MSSDDAVRLAAAAVGAAVLAGCTSGRERPDGGGTRSPGALSPAPSPSYDAAALTRWHRDSVALAARYTASLPGLDRPLRVALDAYRRHHLAHAAGAAARLAALGAPPPSPPPSDLPSPLSPSPLSPSPSPSASAAAPARPLAPSAARRRLAALRRAEDVLAVRCLADVPRLADAGAAVLAAEVAASNAQHAALLARLEAAVRG